MSRVQLIFQKMQQDGDAETNDGYNQKEQVHDVFLD